MLSVNSEALEVQKYIAYFWTPPRDLRQHKRVLRKIEGMQAKLSFGETVLAASFDSFRSI